MGLVQRYNLVLLKQNLVRRNNNNRNGKKEVVYGLVSYTLFSIFTKTSYYVDRVII